jgi:hypothetical protein
MLRMFTCAALGVAAIVAVSAKPVLAESAAKEISSYNKMKVTFTKNAKKCGFESLEPFERHLRDDLAAVGVKQNDASIIEVSLEVGAINYGALDSQCAIDVSLDFRTTLTAANINTNNPQVRQAVDRLGAFPVSLYNVGAFAVSTTLYTVYDNRNITKAEAEVLKIVKRLVTRFQEERAK